ncbi:MAG: hypothetical protein IPP33_07735 [Flavobacteriales bacterium]|nr:hypothetical protein [Flavobacteriales bacterium]
MQYPELGDLWAYDQAADTWTQKATLFNTYYYEWVHTDVWGGFVLGGKGFAIKLDYSFGEVWAYDPPSDSWSPRTTIDFDLLGWTGGQRGIGFALGNHGFLLSMGWPQDPLYPTHPNMFLRYSPDTDAWQLMGYFSGLSRDDVAWAAHEDVAFILGGAHLYPGPDPDRVFLVRTIEWTCPKHGPWISGLLRYRGGFGHTWYSVMTGTGAHMVMPMITSAYAQGRHNPCSRSILTL